MKNQFTVNYKKRTLKLIFENETFKFDLDEGDIGDFWHSFTLKNGIVKDINFHQENEEQTPIVMIYDVTENSCGILEIDTSKEVVIEKHKTKGEPNDYFNHIREPEEVDSECEDALNTMINETLYKIINFIQESPKAEFSEHIGDEKCLKITQAEYQYNLEGGRWLTEITDEMLIDNNGYQYDYSVLEVNSLMTVIDYLIAKYEI